MRECARSGELRAALATGEPLADALEAHVAACARCTRTSAAANRFDARLDAAMAELVTDALPPSTLAVARTAPPAPGRRPSPGMLAGAIVAAAVMAFAVVGVVTTGATLSNAIRDGAAPGSGSTDPGLEAIDCYLGDPVVDVVAEGDGPKVRIAYCVDGTDRLPVAGQHVVTCVQSGSGSAPQDHDATYLAACSRVEDVRAATDRATEVEELPGAPSAPFRTWDEARAAVRWTVQEPGWLPEGYDLAALQGFAAASDPGAIGTVVAIYLRDGTPLSIEQFAIGDSDDFRVELELPRRDIGAVTTGRTMVGQLGALWADGVAVQTGSGLQAETLVLTWRNDRVGFRITARDGDLDALRRIGASLGEG